jgi:SHS2 domain-containing protein
VYQWVDHTAELQLAIEAASEREVFADALRALSELLGLEALAAAPERRTVEVEASDRAALLAGWLDELVFLAESDGFVATSLESIELTEVALSAVVAGSLGEPPPLVKAVTYHRLAFDRVDAGYVASVVLDV